MQSEILPGSLAQLQTNINRGILKNVCSQGLSYIGVLLKYLTDSGKTDLISR
jgi:hypothetical protein